MSTRLARHVLTITLVMILFDAVMCHGHVLRQVHKLTWYATRQFHRGRHHVRRHTDTRYLVDVICWRIKFDGMQHRATYV